MYVKEFFKLQTIMSMLHFNATFTFTVMKGIFTNYIVTYSVKGEKPAINWFRLKKKKEIMTILDIADPGSQ